MAAISHEKAIALIPRVRELALQPGMTDALIGQEIGDLSASQIERIRRLGGIPSSAQLTRKYNDTSRTAAAQGECPQCELLVDLRDGKPVEHNRLVPDRGRLVASPCPGQP